MPNYIIKVNRESQPPQHHILLHIDAICSQENLPQIDEIHITPDKGPVLFRSQDNKMGDFILLLSWPILPFISFGELQMYIHWAFLKFQSDDDTALKQLLSRYPTEDALGLVIKTEAIADLWDAFKVTTEYIEQVKESPSMALFCFKEHLSSKAMYKTVEVRIKANKVISRRIRDLSGSQLSTFLDNSALIKSNRVFDLTDQEFILLSTEILSASYK